MRVQKTALEVKYFILYIGTLNNPVMYTGDDRYEYNEDKCKQIENIGHEVI